MNVKCKMILCLSTLIAVGAGCHEKSSADTGDTVQGEEESEEESGEESGGPVDDELAESLVGIWKSPGPYGNEMIYEFRKDGSMTSTPMEEYEERYSGTWELKDSVLSMTLFVKDDLDCVNEVVSKTNIALVDEKLYFDVFLRESGVGADLSGTWVYEETEEVMTQCGTAERYAAYSDYTTGTFSVSEDNFQLNIAYGNTESLADGGVEMNLDGTARADGKDVMLDFSEKSMRDPYITEFFWLDSDGSLLGYRIFEGVIVFETHSDVTLESLAYTKIDEIP